MLLVLVSHSVSLLTHGAIEIGSPRVTRPTSRYHVQLLLRRRGTLALHDVGSVETGYIRQLLTRRAQPARC